MACSGRAKFVRARGATIHFQSGQDWFALTRTLGFYLLKFSGIQMQCLLYYTDTTRQANKSHHQKVFPSLLPKLSPF